MEPIASAIRAFISDPLVYPLYVAFLLSVALFAIAVVQSLTTTPRTFSWQLVGQWADDYLGPTVLLSILGLVVWLAGLGATADSPVKLVIDGLAALYVAAVATWDATLAAKIGAHFQAAS